MRFKFIAEIDDLYTVKASSQYTTQLRDVAMRLVAWKDAAGYVAVLAKCSQIAALAEKQVALPRHVVERHIVN